MFRFGMAHAAFLSWLLFGPMAEAANLPVSGGIALYHVAGDDAAIALGEFSRQSGVQLVFPVKAVRGVQTNGVEGRHAAGEALQLLLAGTPLEAVQDPATGAWAVRRTPLGRVSPKKPQSPERPLPAPSDEPVEIDAFEVRSRRDAGIQTQTIFRTDAQAPIYHQVITRKQIEALGVTSVAELMTMVSGYSGQGIENLQSSVNLSLDQSGQTLYNGAFLKLRGFDSTRTAVLLNGRRLPLNLDSHGPDLSRIPLAAVAQVNVLPFSGSALYGDNVIGGAVDIVLRKDYVGHSLSWLYGTTTRGGGDESSVTAVEGMTLGDGGTRATVILDYQHRSALQMSDRDFLKRAESRYPLEDVWARVRTSRYSLNSADEHYFLTASPSYPAVAMVAVANLGLGIPGEEDRPFAVFPRGQDGTQLTPASFSSSANSAVLERRNERATLRRPTGTYSVTAQLEHAFVPEKWEMYAEIGYSRAVDRFSSPDSVIALRLENYQSGNPFSTPFAPGSVERPIYVFFDPIDLPDNTYDQDKSGARLVVGLKGVINQRWSWTVDSSFDYTKTIITIDSPNRPLNALMARISVSGLDFSTWKTIYNPLADHRAFPVSQQTIDRYFSYRTVAISDADVYGINARVYGTPVDLAAGPLGVSLRSEYRRELNHAQNRTDASAELNRLVGNLPSSSTTTWDRSDSLSIVAEARVPLIGQRWRPIPLDTAELNAGSRAFQTPQGGIKFSQILAVKISPAPWIALRGSYSEGYMAPLASTRKAPAVTSYGVGGLVDPMAPTDPPYTRFNMVFRGNPTLRAETSVAKVAGILLRPQVMENLSFSADFWSITGKNGIRQLAPQEILDHPEAFADRVTRTPLPFGERLVTIDDAPINMAAEYSSGVDLAMNGHVDFSRYGGFDFSAAATLVKSYREQVVASAPPVDLLSRVGSYTRGYSESSPQIPLRGRATLAWEKGALRLGLTANYLSRYRADVLPSSYIPPTADNPNEILEQVSSSILWDLQVNYVTSHTGWGRGRTTWTVGVRNLFDRAPSYRTDGVAFYSHFEDPRMRFIYLRVQQEW